jgi:hypothetical protein
MMEGSVSEAPNKHGSTSNPVATRVRAVSVSNASSTSASKTNKRKSTSLPTETVEYLKAWMMSPEHIAHPYPTEQEKAKIMADTCIELKQLTNWFVNNRKRYWKPRVEARVQTQASFKTAPSNTSKNTANTETAPVDLFDPDLAIVATTTGSANQPEISAPSDVPLAKIVSVASFQALLEKASVSLSPISTHNSVFHHVESLLNGPSRLVSDASDSSSIGTEDETSSNTSTAGSVTTPQSEGIKTEQMSVHILRHTGQVPTVEDVTILTNVPAERILRTFDDCVLSYRVPTSGNRKKVGRGSPGARSTLGRYLLIGNSVSQSPFVWFRRVKVVGTPKSYAPRSTTSRFTWQKLRKRARLATRSVLRLGPNEPDHQREMRLPRKTLCRPALSFAGSVSNFGRMPADRPRTGMTTMRYQPWKKLRSFLATAIAIASTVYPTSLKTYRGLLCFLALLSAHLHPLNPPLARGLPVTHSRLSFCLGSTRHRITT